MGRLLGVAAVQMAPVPWDPAASLKKLADTSAQVVAQFPWADLLLFPELCVTGFAPFVPKPDGMPDRAEPIAGPTSDALRALARKVGRWIVPGSLLESADGRTYNTALVISPDGEIRARYRKMFPWRPFEHVSAGDSFCVFEIPDIGTLGLCICYDMWFPEVARTLCWMGAEVILTPSATATPDRPAEMLLCQANAIFNQCFFVDANLTGPFGGGGSLIADPDGRLLQRADQHETILAQILDLDAVSRAREQGTPGLNPLWKILRDSSVPFPPYTQGIAAGPMVKALGPLQGTLQGPTPGSSWR